MPRPLRSRGSLALFAAASACVVAAATASAADAPRPTRIRVREGGAVDSLTVKGTFAGFAELPPDASLTVLAGDLSHVVPAGELRRSRNVLRYVAPPGAGGLRSFTLNRRSGTFVLVLGGADLGPDFAGPGADDLPLTIDLGGRRWSGLYPLAGENARRKWNLGDPFRAFLDLRVYLVGTDSGNLVVSPAGGRPFVPPVTVPPGIRILDTDGTTGADGRLGLLLELTDPDLLEGIDPAFLVGTSPGLSLPSATPFVAGAGGRFGGAIFLQPLHPDTRTVTPADGAKIVVDRGTGLPGGEIELPAGAIDDPLAGFSFTPLGLGLQLPLPLPPDFLPVAAADVRATVPAVFTPGKGARMSLRRPAWARRASLRSADLRLLRYRDGAWSEVPGRGAYDEAADAIVPASADPALLPGTGPAVWAIRTSGAPKPRVRGRVRDAVGDPVDGRVVLGRNGVSVTGSDGAFDLLASAADEDSLEVVQSLPALVPSARVADGATSDTADIRDPVPEPPLRFGLVTGRVLLAGGDTPVAGAEVTVRLASAVRGLLLDDGGTPENAADDRFVVPDLSDLGVGTFRWSILVPGDTSEFLSDETGPSVAATALLLDAQAAGRPTGEGPYTVRVAYDVPVLGEVSLYAGFRLTVDGISPGVTDVQLPAAVEGTAARTVTTDADGRYEVFLRAPSGVPMTATAVLPGGTASTAESFFFDAEVAADLVFARPAPAPRPAGLVHGWNTLAPMAVARSGCVPVRDGDRIVVIGGNGGPLAVESFDLSAGTWSTGTPSTLDHGQVSSGFGAARVGRRVLAAGGAGRRTASYDLDTDTWTEEPQMAVSRLAPSVTAHGGRVFVFGGYDGGSLHASVEVFDPATGGWTSGPTMPRASFQDNGGGAVVIGGTIAVLGRSTFSTGPHHMRLDTASGLWATLPAPDAARRSFTVANLLGELVTTGGEPPSTVEVYDAAAETWRTEATIPGSPQRQRPGTIAVDDVLYAFGGFTFEGASGRIADVLAYRLPWPRRTDAPTPVRGAGATLSGRRIYVAGGELGGSPVGTVSAYDPESDFWRSLPALPTPRTDVSVVALAGRIHVIGGRNAAGDAVARVEVLDPATGTWTTGVPLSQPRAGAAACVVDGRILVVGGADGTCEQFDPATGVWTPRASALTSRVGAAAALFQGRVHVVGGRVGGVPSATTERFDPVQNTWTPGPPLAAARARAGLAEADGALWCVGGEDVAGNPVATVEVLSPTIGSWATGPALPGVRSGPAVASRDGVLYVVGGADASGTALRSVLAHEPE